MNQPLAITKFKIELPIFIDTHCHLVYNLIWFYFWGYLNYNSSLKLIRKYYIILSFSFLVWIIFRARQSSPKWFRCLQMKNENKFHGVFRHARWQCQFVWVLVAVSIAEFIVLTEIIGCSVCRESSSTYFCCSANQP